MCGPLTTCCCLPIKTGIRVVCTIMICLEIGLGIHNGILVHKNAIQFFDVTGGVNFDDDIQKIQTILISVAYSLSVILNIVLIIATFLENR